MRSACLALALLVTGACAGAPPLGRTPNVEGVLPSGAAWSAVVPANWNGTLLLHSRGYASTAGRPEPAPPQYSDALLARGYALAASNFGSGGWALAEAVPAQKAATEAFADRYGQPESVIAYGFSMGGLVTAALAEDASSGIDGAISFCGSIGGSIDMMNMGLDGAFVFKTLVAPGSPIRLVDIGDDRANGALVQTAVGEAMESPAGRARLVLAATLAGLPAWVPDRTGESAEQRQAREVDALLQAFPMGAFLPRAEQEERAGVGYSWNGGVDYAVLLARSGRAEFVRSIYRSADLDLDADLARLKQAPRIQPVASAVDYMTRNYVPTGRPKIPMLAVQALGDGVTSPSLQEAYAKMAPAQMFRSLYLPQAGHCTFSEDQFLASLAILERRRKSGNWRVPQDRFSTLSPQPMPRQ